MYAYGFIKAEPMRATDIYTEQCAEQVNVRVVFQAKCNFSLDPGE